MDYGTALSIFIVNMPLVKAESQIEIHDFYKASELIIIGSISIENSEKN